MEGADVPSRCVSLRRLVLLSAFGVFTGPDVKHGESGWYIVWVCLLRPL